MRPDKNLFRHALCLLVATLLAGCGTEQLTSPVDPATGPTLAQPQGTGGAVSFIVEPGAGGVYGVGDVAMTFGPDAVAAPLRVTIRDGSEAGEVRVLVLPKGYQFKEAVTLRIGDSVLRGSVWNRLNVFGVDGKRGLWVLTGSQGPYAEDLIDIENEDDPRDGFGRAGW